MIRHPEMKKRASVAAALILLLSGCSSARIIGGLP